MDHINIQRWRTAGLRNALKYRRVVIISGPRQCGKTTLAKAIQNPADELYVTLDDETLKQAALDDPRGFVTHDKSLMIIDEIQKVPALLSAIKQEVDENPIPGRYLLTGSANIALLPQTTESLAGRITNIRLRTLSQGEIAGTTPNFLEACFQQSFKKSLHLPYLSKNDYINLALKGGYPEAIRLPETEIKNWHKDYIEAIMLKDLHDVANIQHQDSLNKLFQILAAWSSKYMDISAIGSHLAITRPTITSYINALEILYLVERLSPWCKTDYDRVGKQDKLFIPDTGLMASLLNWRFDEVQYDGDKNGKLLETYVFTQLMPLIEASPYQYQLYHYRDRDKREIDFILENEDGDIVGIDVKAGSALTSQSFKHMKWFGSHLAKKKFIGIILYSGAHVLSFGENFWAVPLQYLWQEI